MYVFNTKKKRKGKIMIKIREKYAKLKENFYKSAGNKYIIASEVISNYDEEKRNEIIRKVVGIFNATVIGTTILSMVAPAFATTQAPRGGKPDANGVAESVLTEIINIILKVFRYVGVILAVYSIGQLVFAFKNEDPDSKSRAATQIVIACVLIGLDVIIEGLDLVQYLN